MKYRPLISSKLILLIAACAGVADVNSGSQTRPTLPPTMDVSFTAPPKITQQAQASNSPDLKTPIEKAKGDLAQRLSISVTEIDLVEAKDVIWPDASLGCPQSGMIYAQMETEGFIIQLEAQGQTYEYHTDKDATVILCEYTPERSNLKKEIDKNVKDVWPNQTKDQEVIIVTPTHRK
jgi:hypothetical protein